MKRLTICASGICLGLAATSLLAATQPVKAAAKSVKKVRTVKAIKTVKKIKKYEAKRVVVAREKMQHRSVPVLKITQQPLTIIKARSRFNLHGFLSAGVSATDNKAAYNIPNHGAVTSNPTFSANSLIGLQLGANLTSQLSAVGQFVANGDATNGKKAYIPTVDFAFLRYAPQSNLQFRAGRFRIPLFMYSDTAEVGYSYANVNLPSEVYRLVPFYNMNGANIIYKMPLGNSSWSLKVQPFMGMNKSDYDLPGSYDPILGQSITAKFDENKILGAAVDLGNQYVTLRAAYAQTKLSGYLPAGTMVPGAMLKISTSPNVPLPEKLNIDTNELVRFVSTGINVNYDNFLFTSEFANRSGTDSIAGLRAYYATLGYHLGKFLPNITYASLSTTNVKQLNATLKKSGLAEQEEAQKSYTAGLDYFVNSNLVVKAAVSHIKAGGANGLGLFLYAPGKPVNLYTLSASVVF